jgi:hypothetical protein
MMIAKRHGKNIHVFCPNCRNLAKIKELLTAANILFRAANKFEAPSATKKQIDVL